MGSTNVSVVVPLSGASVELDATTESIRRYLETTGFTFEIVTAHGAGYGDALRKGCAEAKGGVVVVVDPELPYPVSAIGDAVAMVEAGTTEVVFASTRSGGRARHAIVRSMLVPILPDPAIHLKAFSWHAMKLVVGETKLTGFPCDLEIAFLANKYGFRIETLIVQTEGRVHTHRSYGAIGGVVPAMRIRMIDRRNGYRAARRCPVCFSPAVWTCAQIPEKVVRSCRRCKCRYLNQFSEELDNTQPVRRVLRPHAPPAEPTYETHSAPAREKTSTRRLGVLRKHLHARARVLEVGVRDGSFGTAASGEYEYVGIDPAPAASRHARSRGLDVYCASLQNFVNTGPSFDAITLYHVFENMADPHDALARIKDLLKPGGVLLISTFDTEGIVYLLSERSRMAQNFRTHLILYSRSALIELLEHSGFEIVAIGPDFEYRDHRFLRHHLASRWPHVAPLARTLLRFLPDPLLISSGSIRIVAKRRGGPTTNVRAIRSVEPTHAR